MGGGSQKGGGGTAKDQAKLNTQLFEESTPVRQELLGQTLEALQTGGVNAQIPIIQRSLEATNAASSRALQDFDARIASTPGLAGTPVAELLRSQLSIEAERGLADVGPGIARGVAAGASNLALGFPQIANQGLEAAAGGQTTAKGQALKLFFPLGAAGASGLASLFGGCWVAEAIWGEEHPHTNAARHWAMTHDNWFTRLYQKHGQDWAFWVQGGWWRMAAVWPIWRLMAALGHRS